MGLTLRPRFLCGISSTNWKGVWLGPRWIQPLGKIKTSASLGIKPKFLGRPPFGLFCKLTSRFHIVQVLRSNLVQAINPVFWFSFLCCSSGQSRGIKNRPRPLYSIFPSISRFFNQCNTFRLTTSNLSNR